MRKLAIANRKGGVGKTTTAVNLSYCLSNVGKKVLLVDTDTQNHCAMMLGVQPGAGLADLLDGSAQANEVIFEVRPKLWLMAGGRDLAGVSRDIARRDFRSEQVLAEAMEAYEGLFDYVILDTAPGYSTLSINVLFYCQEIMCPVSMETLSVEGLASFLEEIEPIKRYSALDVRYVLPTFADGRVRKTDEIMAQLKQHFGQKVCLPVRYSVKLSEAPGWGKPIFEYSPKDRGALDYAKIAGEVERG